MKINEEIVQEFRFPVLMLMQVMVMALSFTVSFAGEQNAFPAIEATAGVEKVNGDMVLQAGGNMVRADGGTLNAHFPVSEMTWPVDAWLGRIGLGATIHTSLRVNASIQKELSRPGDAMVYRDWLTLSDPDRLDVYSESDISDFDATVMDFDVAWDLVQRETFSLQGGLGYRRQKYAYAANPLFQYSPSGLPGAERRGDGSAGLKYAISSNIPYVFAGLEYALFNRLSLSARVAYSPWVDTGDRLTHVYYDNLVSNGDMEGDAIIADVSARYDLTASSFIRAGMNYTKIDADGIMSTVLPQGVETIEEESETNLTSVYLRAGVSF